MKTAGLAEQRFHDLRHPGNTLTEQHHGPDTRVEDGDVVRQPFHRVHQRPTTLLEHVFA
jgi:hypothetical protein